MARRRGNASSTTWRRPPQPLEPGAAACAEAWRMWANDSHAGVCRRDSRRNHQSMKCVCERGENILDRFGFACRASVSDPMRSHGSAAGPGPRAVDRLWITVESPVRLYRSGAAYERASRRTRRLRTRRGYERSSERENVRTDSHCAHGLTEQSTIHAKTSNGASGAHVSPRSLPPPTQSPTQDARRGMTGTRAPPRIPTTT